MSNKHYVKRLKRKRKERGLGSIKELYDVARRAEQQKKEIRRQQISAAYAQLARDKGGMPSADAELRRFIQQDAKRRQKVGHGG